MAFKYAGAEPAGMTTVDSASLALITAIERKWCCSSEVMAFKYAGAEPAGPISVHDYSVLNYAKLTRAEGRNDHRRTGRPGAQLHHRMHEVQLPRGWPGVIEHPESMRCSPLSPEIS
ncbi:uncharacterized protein LOC120413430 [Culex pipiens pallens]|uniref:uncharacterized protein LOC120413430 n=1 Tax=Culex pipiens pallens TaxID=42434 RepID=UPI001952E270|nr:uncharacterized protein LOC120413430 [Culex pipiens pallens]